MWYARGLLTVVFSTNGCNISKIYLVCFVSLCLMLLLLRKKSDLMKIPFLLLANTALVKRLESFLWNVYYWGII